MQLDLNHVGDAGGDPNLTSIANINMEDQEQCANLEGKINSPRTLEAMATLGLDAFELQSIKMEDVKNYYRSRDRNPNVN